MELLAGDPAAAERELRDAIEVVQRMGAARYVAFYRCQLADVLLTLGRDEDASLELEQARELYGAMPSWQMAQARVLARRDRTEEAVALALRAVQALATYDDITLRADTLISHAEVLHAHGDDAGARSALVEAIALHEEKGNVLNAEQCRELLAALDS
jgi:hypothetical protein